MALEDYIPNIFGGTPTIYQGLLSPQEQASLEKRSNLAGLLGFGAALAQGMSGGGYPRSALQNILTAAAQGFSGAGQTYQAGIGQLAEVQKLQQSRAQINAINQLLQDPRVANDPMMQAYIRANPAEAIKYFAEMAPIREAISPTPSLISPVAPMAAPAPQPVPQPAPQPQVSFMRGADSQQMPEFSGQPETFPIPMEGVEPQEVQETNVLPEVVVQAQAPKVDPLVARRDALIAENERLSRIPTKLAQDRIEGNIKQIDTLDKQLSRRAVQDFDFSVIKDTIPPQFKGEVDKLEQLAVTGAITGNELRQGLQDLNKRAMEFVTKKTDYTNQDRRVAAAMFAGRDIAELNPAELMQLENKLYEMRIAERKAGATSINMPTESERTAGFLTNRVVNSLNQLQAVVGVNPTAASPNFGAEAVKFLTGSDYLKNLANPETRQQVEAAELEFLDAALTLGTGAAYTREQLQGYRKSYFPQLGDKPATIKDKQNRLKSLVDSAIIKSGRAAPAMPSNMAPAFDMDAIQRELDRRKGK
jgi:hypothetical protein